MAFGGYYEDVLEYAETMIGVPYRWWNSGDSIESDDKFWASNDGYISREYINENDKCIVCTGLINLMRRYRGLEIPGCDGFMGKTGLRFPGTTYTWFRYLNKKGFLESYSEYEEYPRGTLLIRNYKNVRDQGHVAVLIGNKQIIHACSDYNYDDSVREGIVDVGSTRIDELEDVQSWLDGNYFTHICRPENWL
jgi:cell wall-associated NlpC family hydrolase